MNGSGKLHTFYINNWFIRNSSQVGLLTQETNPNNLCLHSRSESLFSFTINIEHMFLYTNQKKKY